MKLVSFSIQNYRSITTAHKIRIGQSLVLVGPNNEGKSNILRALVTALTVMTNVRDRRFERGGLPGRFARLYDWERDFPQRLQGKNATGESRFTLEFELSTEETGEFWTEVKSSLNGTLPVELSFGKERARFRVVKKGPGAKALSQKSQQIVAFVSKRLDFQYIPAVRTASAAENVVEEMLAIELRRVEDDPAFKKALQDIADLQKPVLDALSAGIKNTLGVFVPDVKAVEVRISDENRYTALRRSCEMIVDDGTATLLQHKGDGVQSLTAISVMRHSSESGARGKNLIIALEEPESHLHPLAIHRLKLVLQDLAKRHQVVISTHCPLLVDRVSVRNNILVAGGRAKQAKHVAEIRDTLGVRAADNLRHAELVLLVEGTEDQRALDAVFRQCSHDLRSALENGTLAIDAIGGSGNLSYKAGEVIGSLCAVHAFLDHDRAGIQGANQAKVDGRLSDADLNYATCDGMAESELEDLYDPSVYAAALASKYRVTLQPAKLRSNKKWSDRVANAFKLQGKHWDQSVELQVKGAVADAVAANPANAVNERRRAPLDALMRVLVERLEQGSGS